MKINEIEFEAEAMSESNGEIYHYMEIESINLLNFDISYLPLNHRCIFVPKREKELRCRVHPTFMITSIDIDFFEKREAIEITVSTDLDLWNLKWDMKAYVKRLLINIEESKEFKIEKSYIEDDVILVFLNIPFERDDKIKEIIKSNIDRLDGLLRITDFELGGFKWKESFLENEKLFSLEIVEPLLRKLQYESVIYNHGTREYGKDFICTEKDNFGFERHIGIQVKAGNLRGNVNSEIDEILGQLEDAFSMPFYSLGIETPKYISIFVVLISGLFTQNAKDKINKKIPSYLKGNVIFIDKNKIHDLIARVQVANKL